MMKFPKTDFAIGIYNHKSSRDRFHARILGLVQESGCLEMEEVECLYTPVNEICNEKCLAHSSEEKDIEAYLKKRKQRIPPFRIFLRSGQGELFFQSETHFEEGRKERRVHFYPGESQALGTLKLLHTLSEEITGDTASSEQLSAIERLAAAFGEKYAIEITVSKGFVSHYEGEGELNALTLWNELWNFLHGKHDALDGWPCRFNAYFEIHLSNVSSKWSYSLTMSTEKCNCPEEQAIRQWNFFEEIFNSNDMNSPIFQVNDTIPRENGLRNVPERLTSCQHPFIKEILDLPLVSMVPKQQR